MTPRPLILASGSPRRRDLLLEAGYTFEVRTAPVEEREEADEGVDALVSTNAQLKCRAVARHAQHATVIGSDTLVALEERPLGKPRDHDEAFRMLRSLVGRTHVVATAVCLSAADLEQERTFVVRTRMTFRPLPDETIRDYLRLIDPLDKAGAYAAQDHGEIIIERTEGSWSNVVGLPMETLRPALREFGVPEPLQAS